MMDRRVFATAAIVMPWAAMAQTWPDRPITFLVGFAPGGAVDIVGRIIAAPLQQALGQSIIVENRPGANGNLAASTAARAKPDGYTILVGANGLVTNMALYDNPGFDPERDFDPIVTVGEAPPLLAAGPGFKGSTLADVIAQAKAAPDSLAYGSPGAGSSAHLTMELFQRAAGIKLRHVAYRGGAPAISDAIGGHIPLLAANLPEVIGQVQSGQVRALGVPTLKRNPMLPDVPTVAEQGFPGFEATTWWGLFAPRGTPRPIIDRINADVRKAQASPDFVAALQKLGGVVKQLSPEELAALLTSERARWGKIIKEENIVGE